MTAREHPYFLVNAFFINLEFSREPEVPDNLKADFIVEAKLLHLDQMPDRVQVNFRLATTEEESVQFSVEMVALFGSSDPKLLGDKAQLANFLEDRGIFMLWPMASQMIRIVTGQMGMKPLEISYPRKLELNELLEQTTEE